MDNTQGVYIALKVVTFTNYKALEGKTNLD